MRHHGLVMALFLLLTVFGIYSLPKMNKDEFPQFTIRQALVVALYPGATASEVEQQVTMPLEDYINSFEAVNKSLTFSNSKDGFSYVYVMLRMHGVDGEKAWNKIRAGLPVLQKTQLPAGVLPFGGPRQQPIFVMSTACLHFTSCPGSDRLRWVRT